MKTVSVIGPSKELLAKASQHIRHCQVLIGAGPEAGMDIVVAVLDSFQESDAEVLRSVRCAMGVCIVYISSDAVENMKSTKEGQDILRVRGLQWVTWTQDVGDQESVNSLNQCIKGYGVDKTLWLMEARRADMERVERTKLAIRLSMQQKFNELLPLPPVCTPGEFNREQCEFLAQKMGWYLEKIVAEQGLIFPVAAIQSNFSWDGGEEKRGTLSVQDSIVLIAGLFVGVAVGRALFLYFSTLWSTENAVILSGVIACLSALAVTGMRLAFVRETRKKEKDVWATRKLQDYSHQLMTEVLGKVEIPQIVRVLEKE